MLKKLGLYFRVLTSIKPSQTYYRLKKMLKLPCRMSVKPAPWQGQIQLLDSIKELDFDPVFLSRFSANDLTNQKVTFLYETEQFKWDSKWDFQNRSPLWNFNLHYFEFLFPLISAYNESKDEKYIRKIKSAINGWINNNPSENGGAGWSAYTISLRLVNWISVYTWVKELLDDEFSLKMLSSMYEQYVFLANHLEKDLLANHYFEDLKALVICSLFFKDDAMCDVALCEFKKQCKEQILPDGMHFELSPMYHKIILEDVLRVAVALRSADKRDLEIEGYIQPMLDVAYSLEEGLHRVPLFNDGGNNITKDLKAIQAAAENHFGITPCYKSQFPHSGYYIFKEGAFKLIVDAGAPGPKYNPGHAHCDAMSFELYYNGEPVLVNCGTYAYQCDKRSFFRSTSAHNTVMANGVEQSQCWSAFRMGKGSTIKSVSVDGNSIQMSMTDQKGVHIKRALTLESDKLSILDESRGNRLTSYLHTPSDKGFSLERVEIDKGSVSKMTMPYAPDFGMELTADVLKVENDNSIHLVIKLER